MNLDQDASEYLPESPKIGPNDLPEDGTDLSVTVATIGEGEYTNRVTGKTEYFLKLYFEEIEGDKYFKVGPKANKTLQAMYGKKLRDWIGKRVVLTLDEWDNAGTLQSYVKIKKLNTNGRPSRPTPATTPAAPPAYGEASDLAEGDDLPF